MKTLLKTLEKVGKFALENLKRNMLREPIFIGFSKYSRWDPEQAQNGLLVNHPIDRPTIRFLTVWITSRPPQGKFPSSQPPGRPRPEPESSLSGSVDDRSTGARSREQALRIGRPHGPPAQSQNFCACSVHIGRPTGRPSSGPVDRSVDHQQAQVSVLGFENLVY